MIEVPPLKAAEAKAALNPKKDKRKSSNLKAGETKTAVKSKGDDKSNTTEKPKAPKRKLNSIRSAKQNLSSNWFNLQKQIKKPEKPAADESTGVARRLEEKKRKLERLAEKASTSDDKKGAAPTTTKIDTISFSETVHGKGIVALDCEFVGTGHDKLGNMLARVSIVDARCKVLLDKYVRPTEKVTDYRTKFSGIRPSLLENGAEDFKSVQKEVADLLKGKYLVLKLSHPRSQIRDTSVFSYFRELTGDVRKPSLKVLSRTVLGVEIQKGEHDSVADARAAMQLYQLHRKRWETHLKQKRKEKHNKKVQNPTES